MKQLLTLILMSQCAISSGQSISVRCSKTAQSLVLKQNNLMIQAGKSQDRNGRQIGGRFNAANVLLATVFRQPIT